MKIADNTETEADKNIYSIGYDFTFDEDYEFGVSKITFEFKEEK